jgi:hypothetical protein
MKLKTDILALGFSLIFRCHSWRGIGRIAIAIDNARRDINPQIAIK